MPTASVAVVLLALALAPAAAAQPVHRIAVGGLSAESNSFYPAANDFNVRPASPRDAWLEESARGRGVLSGQIEAAGRLGLELHPIVSGRASFLGVVRGRAFEERSAELVRQLREARPRFDGVFLNLHGAMVVEGHPHGDAELVRRVREAMGPDFPIVVLHDFHANVPPSIVEHSTVLITYKEHPHVDTMERGIQSAEIMARILKGEVRPVQAVVKPAMVLNLIHHNTFTGPLKPIVAESRRLERENPKILAVSVPGGYQWADVPYVGPSAVVVTDGDPGLAQREAQRLADMVYALRDHLPFDAPDTATAVSNAMRADAFPVVIMDTGDNIGGGSVGDSTFFLAELLRQEAVGWAMSIADPEAVTAAARAGVGQPFDFAVGAKRDRLHGEPVRVRGVVRSLHAGPAGNQAAAVSAVIRVDGGSRDAENLLILTPRASGLRSVNELVEHGIRPERLRIVVSKGTVAPFETFQKVAARFILAASPGPTDVDVSKFRFTRARRPLHGIP
jgi:microcystin degradation protein MlrC